MCSQLVKQEKLGSKQQFFQSFLLQDCSSLVAVFHLSMYSRFPTSSFSFFSLMKAHSEETLYLPLYLYENRTVLFLSRGDHSRESNLMK